MREGMTKINSCDWYPTGNLQTDSAIYDFGIFKDNSAVDASKRSKKSAGGICFSRTILLLFVTIAVVFMVVLTLTRNGENEKSNPSYRRLLALAPKEGEKIPTERISGSATLALKRSLNDNSEENNITVDQQAQRPNENHSKLRNISESIPIFEINDLASSRTVLQSVESPAAVLSPSNRDKYKRRARLLSSPTADWKVGAPSATILSKRTLLLPASGRYERNDKFGEFDEAYENNIEFAQLRPYRNFDKIKSIADMMRHLGDDFDNVLESPTVFVVANEPKPFTSVLEDDHQRTTAPNATATTENGTATTVDDNQQLQDEIVSASSNNILHTEFPAVEAENPEPSFGNSTFDNLTIDRGRTPKALRRFSNRINKKRHRNQGRPTTTMSHLDYFLKPPTPGPETQSLSLTPSSSYTEAIFHGLGQASQFRNSFAEPPARFPATIKPISLMMEIFPIGQPPPNSPVHLDNTNGDQWFQKNGEVPDTQPIPNLPGADISSLIPSGQLPFQNRMWLHINLYSPKLDQLPLNNNFRGKK